MNYFKGRSIILYHGSNVEVKEPRIIISNRTLDFGARFESAGREWLRYVTDN